MPRPRCMRRTTRHRPRYRLCFAISRDRVHLPRTAISRLYPLNLDPRHTTVNAWFGREMGHHGKSGGEGGIRTLERLAPLPVFKTGAFNHSATSPEPALSRNPYPPDNSRLRIRALTVARRRDGFGLRPHPSGLEQCVSPTSLAHWIWPHQGASHTMKASLPSQSVRKAL